MKLFGQLNAGMQFGKGTMINLDGTDGEKNKVTTYLASIEPGIAVFPHKKIAIELKVPLVNYLNQKTDYDNANSTDFRSNQFFFGSNLNSPILGVNFHF